MKIAFVVNNYPPRVGGVELHVQALARELATQGHQPLVVTLGDRPGPSVDEGVEVITLPERLRVANVLGFPPLGTRRRLRRLLRERNVEIVSVHTRFFPMSFIGVRAARAAAIPAIHTEHGSDHVVSNSTLVALASRLVDLTLGRWVLRNADKVLGVSESAVSFVKRLSGVDADVLYNAIEAPEFQPTHWPNQAQKLVFVGRLVPGKGWETYLECVSNLHRQQFDVHGDVLGDGPDHDKMRERVRELGLEGVVTLHGRVTQTEVRRALRGATLLNPTVLAEGFQTTLLEAIAEGGRVITYPVPGASLLREQGAPVVVTNAKTPEAFSRELTTHFAAAWQQADAQVIEGWTWPVRARAYAEMCAALLSPPDGTTSVDSQASAP